MRIRLYNARILTMEKNRPIFEGEVWIKNGKIAYVGDKDALRDVQMLPQIAWDEEIDCRNNLLMPGFKDAHTHSAMTFLRSFADDLPLNQWLNEKIFPMEARLTAADITAFAKIAILEYLTSGITSIFDMYIQPDAVAAACQEMGMRCVLVSGLNNFTSSLEQTEEEYLKWNQKNSLISYQLGIHAEYTCSKELIAGVSRLAHKYRAPVYLHLAETKKEVADCVERYGVTPTVFLDNMGVFDYGGGGYHCVHMTTEDMEVFRRRKLFAITNPASNMKLASGMAPICEFVKRKIPVAIGTDGPASNNCLDMFREMFLVSGLSKLREEDAASLDATEVLRMATVGGAKAMRLSKSDVIAKGKNADLILLDLSMPNMQPELNIPKNIVYSGSKANVCMTMIGGRVLYRNGQFYVGESKEEIYGRCNSILKRIME